MIAPCLLNSSLAIWALLSFLHVVCGTPQNYFLAPTKDEVIPEDKPYTIQWIPSTPGPVYLQLAYDSDVPVLDITASTNNTGSYVWTPIGPLAGRSDYFLIICDLNLAQGDCSYTINGRFSIASSLSSSSTSSTSTTLSFSSTSATSVTSPTSSFAGTSLTPSSSSPTQPSAPITTAEPSQGSSTVLGITIGVAVALVVIASMAFALLLIWKRRKAQQPPSPIINLGYEAALVTEYEKAELSGEGRHVDRIELPGISAVRERANLPNNNAAPPT